MNARILGTAISEFRIAVRNRWVTISALLMMVFSVVLSAAGAAPTGDIGVDRLSVVVASLTSLSVYLVPLVALLMSFDAVAGEVERGTLPLLLTYPIARAEVLLGKLAAHLVVLTLAILAGYGVAAIAALVVDAGAVAGLPALWRLTWSSVVLGATFIGLGYWVSSLARRPSGAAGLAIGLWLGPVVLYDLALLAGVVANGDGVFTTHVFPALLLANPADAFRLFNLASSTAAAAASGVGGAAASIPVWQSLLSILVWPVLGLGVAVRAFYRVIP